MRRNYANTIKCRLIFESKRKILVGYTHERKNTLGDASHDVIVPS